MKLNPTEIILLLKPIKISFVIAAIGVGYNEYSR
jgi:hypothetical protein